MLHKFIFLIKRTQFFPVGKIKLPHKTYHRTGIQY